MSRRGIKKGKIYVPSLTKKRGLPPEKKNNVSKKIGEKKEKAGGKQAKKQKKKGGSAKKSGLFPRGLGMVLSPSFRSDFHILKGGFAPL